MCVVLFACEPVSSANAETLVYDDFKDGDFLDNKPARWTPIFGANPIAVDGDVRLGSGNCCPGFGWSEAINGDVSIQTQIQRENGEFGLATKFGGGGGNDGYYWIVSSSGNLWFNARVQGIEYPHETGINVELPSDEDIFMQLDVVDNQVAGWFWTESISPPAEPQLDLELDHPLIEGGIAGVYSGGVSTMRYIHIADSPMSVPEPSSTAILFSIVIGLGLFRKHVVSFHRDRRAKPNP